MIAVTEYLKEANVNYCESNEIVLTVFSTTAHLCGNETKTHNYAVSQLLLTNVHRITDAVTKVSEAEKTEKYFTEYTVDD